MSALINEDDWVWVVVQDPGGNEEFLGQHDEQRDEFFVPTFLSREDAEECLKVFPLEKGHRYEAQAIQFGELSLRVAKNGFMVFIVNGSGEIVEKILL